MSRVIATLNSELKLWHGVLGLVVTLLTLGWSAGASWMTLGFSISRLEQKTEDLNADVHKLTDSVLTSDPVSKRDWQEWRERQNVEIATVRAQLDSIVKAFDRIAAKLDK